MRYDVVVIGGGPGGYNAAFRAADLGKTVAIVDERAQLGGVCLNVGCIPSKSLLHLAEGLRSIAHLRELGLIDTGQLSVNLAAVHKYRDKVVKALTQGLKGLAKKRKVEVIQARAKFAGAKQLELSNGERVDFDFAIIATGSRPVQIPGFPADEPMIFDSTGALELQQVPGRMLVIGGGIIGLEMAEVYHTLGTKITIVEMLDHLVPPADADMVRPLAKRLAKMYQIHLGGKVLGISRTEDGLLARFEGKGAPESALFDAVLVAVGRRANSDQLALDAAGVTVDQRGFIEVDRQMRTKVQHIFAIGDVVGQPMLAHKAAHEAKVAAEVICGHQQAFTPLTIPSVAYTEPELAWAGLTEWEAEAEKIAYRKAIFPWAASGRARSMGAEAGMTKLLFHQETGRLIGAAIVGAHAGELISEAALAIEMGADSVDIGATIHPHPTLGETIGLAAEVADGSVTEILAG